MNPVDVKLRMPVADLIPAGVDPTQASASPGVITISKPHQLRIHVGNGSLVVAPGGNHSTTMILKGVRTGRGLDYSKVESITTDSGAELMSREAALELARRWCTIASRGLNIKADTSGFERVRTGELRPHESYEIGRRVSVCDIETPTTAFGLYLSGPPANSVKPEDERFRVQLSLLNRV